MSIDRLRYFVSNATDIVSDCQSEATVLGALRAPMRALLEHDDWLPDAFAKPHRQHYQQYLLHCDPKQRFCVVSFVWGPAQATPIHNHTVWGMIGMLRGSESSTRYVVDAPDKPLRAGETSVLRECDIDIVSPAMGDVHQVRNTFNDRVSISIHVYGANIGRVPRQIYDEATGRAKSFVSGFSSELLPNFWGVA